MIYKNWPLESRNQPSPSTRQQQMVRPARSSDIPGILRLVNQHAQRGDLLPRTAVSIQETLADWLIGEQNGQVIACGSLLLYSALLAEVRSLAVADTVKGQGWGSALVHALIAKARQQHIPTLFALTRAVHFFAQVGFTITGADRFPEKVWRDCRLCPLQHNCDETAVILNLMN